MAIAPTVTTGTAGAPLPAPSATAFFERQSDERQLMRRIRMAST